VGYIHNKSIGNKDMEAESQVIHIRIPAQLYKKTKVAAAIGGFSMTNLICQALKEKLADVEVKA
jgi:predicted HicB family RNase H-like nuclease